MFIIIWKHFLIKLLVLLRDEKTKNIKKTYIKLRCQYITLKIYFVNLINILLVHRQIQAWIQTTATFAHLRTLKNFVIEKSGKRCEKSGKYWIKSGNREILRRFIFSCIRAWNQGSYSYKIQLNIAIKQFFIFYKFTTHS